MNLDKLTVNIKPLSAYQAIDLGMAIARSWYITLWQIWWQKAIFVLIIAMIAVFFMVKDNEDIWLAGIVFIWWLKPVFEKPILIYLSRKLFDQNYTKEQIAQDEKTMPSVGRFLIWRLGFLRIISMSVFLLEGQNAKNAKSRINVLTRKQNGALSLSVLVFMIAEIVTFVVFNYLINRYFFEDTLFEEWLLSVDPDRQFLSVFWVLSYAMISSILAPFYVASGFSVYLCKRSLLEGWDIELIFYKLRYRYQSLKERLTAQGQNHDN